MHCACASPPGALEDQLLTNPLPAFGDREELAESTATTGGLAGANG